MTLLQVMDELKARGYDSLAWVNFWKWREVVIADPEQFKSWSFCAALAVEGNGIDSMADNAIGFRAMRDALGDDVDKYNPQSGLRKMIDYLQRSGALPPPPVPYSPVLHSTPMAAPLLGPSSGEV